MCVVLEAMSDAGVLAGLPRAAAQDMAIHTMLVRVMPTQLGLCNILITSCDAIICLISRYDILACYRDNCHRNNNVLKVKAQAQIQVHMVLFALTHIVS